MYTHTFTRTRIRFALLSLLALGDHSPGVKTGLAISNKISATATIPLRNRLGGFYKARTRVLNFLLR